MDLVIPKNDITEKRAAGYGAVAKLLHWGMALLVLSSLGAMEFRDLFPKGPIRHEVTDWHFQTGLCVLLLIIVRVAWRIKNPIPPIFPPLSRLQKLSSTAAHYFLYATMLVLPLLGVLARQSRGNEVDLFGHILPTFLDEESGLPYALTIKAAHTYLGNIFIGLIVVHALMAIFHHYIRQDNTLSRMLP